MLLAIEDHNLFKVKFQYELNDILNKYYGLKELFYEISLRGSAYIIGGFLRDIANSEKSRDLDVIVSISSIELISILKLVNLNYVKNRHDGIKILLPDFEVDIWSIYKNWAFRMNTVKYNEQNIVNKLASGCFYNFDSLVICIHSKLELSVANYNNAVRNLELDILRRDMRYQKLNMLIEANILRAFYLKQRYGFSYSKTCSNYLNKRILYLRDIHSSNVERLYEILKQYPKYQKYLTKELIISNIKEIKETNNLNTMLDI